MEDPVSEISRVIHTLCQSPPSTQRAAIEHYFTPDASFTHPFCRTGSFNGSRWLIWCIYRWYKIMSPRVELGVDNVAYDPKSLTLYVSLHQVFRIFLLPSIFASHVRLTTVLQLVPHTTTVHNKKQTKYLISSQNDLYQTSEFVKFFSLFRLLYLGVLAWQFIATAFCVMGALLGQPISWVEENMVGGNWQRGMKDVVLAGEAEARPRKEEQKSSITEKGNEMGEIEIGDVAANSLLPGSVASGNRTENEWNGRETRGRDWEDTSYMSDESGKGV